MFIRIICILFSLNAESFISRSCISWCWYIISWNDVKIWCGNFKCAFMSEKLWQKLKFLWKYVLHQKHLINSSAVVCPYYDRFNIYDVLVDFRKTGIWIKETLKHVVLQCRRWFWISFNSLLSWKFLFPHKALNH